MAEIDLVCPWVDGNDPAWQQERQHYVPTELQSGVLMYRDWQLMRYWFRAWNGRCRGSARCILSRGAIFPRG